MPRWATQLRRLAHTLRPLRPRQTLGRLYGEGKRRLGLVRAPAPPAGLRPPRLPHRAPFLAHDPWNTPDTLRTGRFRFLNETRDLGRPVRWNAPGASLLWRFNLHYHHVLPLLGPEEQTALVRDWIAANPVGEGVGGHPYPTALRIVSWCKAADAVREDPTIAASLYRQAGHLARGLEFYHPGNHYLENARALVLAGRAFTGQGEADRWLAKGLAVFRAETPEQVLPDGGYFERSPMYHALMLEAYLDVLNVLPDGHPDASWLCETAVRMTAALQTMTHPDGRIALFNDATLEIALPPSALMDYAEAVLGARVAPASRLPATGLFRYDDGRACLLLDGGPIGPDHLPAHAHADVFTYELSVGGLRFVTDTGVYEYAGPRRAYDRSTAAHNTVTIDGVDQAECWGSFRVARRFPPRAVSLHEEPGRWRFDGAFDGYATLIGDGLVHRRSVTARSGAIHVEDAVDGRGRHEAVSRIHLHPGVVATVESPACVRLEREGVVVYLDADVPPPSGGAPDADGPDASTSLRLETTPYSPRFGEAYPRTTLILQATGAPPFRLAYTFRIP